MISYYEALDLIEKNVIKTKKVLNLKPQKAVGYYLAENLKAKFDLPYADNSSMDGFAVKFSELKPKIKLCEKEARAGDVLKDLPKNTAMPIFTGGLIPKNADTVIEKELTEIKNGILYIKSLDIIKKGRNVRKKGEDVKKASVILKKGEKITEYALPLILSAGINEVKVFEKPKVAIITSGNELIAPGKIPKSNQVIDANTVTLKKLCEKNGIKKIKIFRLKDKKDKIKETIKHAVKEYDFVLTVGGASVGKYDYVKQALEEIKAKKIFWKVAIKPGRPFGMYTTSNCNIFTLPGNPVSSIVCFEQFVTKAFVYFSNGILKENIIYAKSDFNRIKSDERLHILRANLFIKNEENFVKLPGELQNSNILNELSKHDCFIFFENKEIKKGDVLKVKITNK
jgi:molybdopterin molybdotransferase